MMLSLLRASDIPLAAALSAAMIAYRQKTGRWHAMAGVESSFWPVVFSSWALCPVFLEATGPHVGGCTIV